MTGNPWPLSVERRAYDYHPPAPVEEHPDDAGEPREEQPPSRDAADHYSTRPEVRA